MNFKGLIILKKFIFPYLILVLLVVINIIYMYIYNYNFVNLFISLLSIVPCYYIGIMRYKKLKIIQFSISLIIWVFQLVLFTPIAAYILNIEINLLFNNWDFIKISAIGLPCLNLSLICGKLVEAFRKDKLNA